MKKKIIKITESQLTSLIKNQLNMVKNPINEGAIGSDRYERKVSVNIETYGVVVNGNDIDWAVTSDIELNYLIEMEHRSWGVKNISLYSIQGPSEIEITLTLQTEESEDIDITVPLNWENIETEEENGNGVITIGDEITISLKNDEKGDVVVDSIRVPVHTL